MDPNSKVLSSPQLVGILNKPTTSTQSSQSSFVSLPSTSWASTSQEHSNQYVTKVPVVKPNLNLSNNQALPGDQRPVPILQNVVGTVNMCCKLDLRNITFRTRNSEYNPARFSGIVMRIIEPRVTALVFHSGKVVITGAKSAEACRLAARKYTRLLQKLGYPAKFDEFRIINMVATCDLKFPIRVENLNTMHAQFSTYEPELFPGLIYRMVYPRVVLLIFCNGKICFTGGKSQEELNESLEIIYPILKSFKKQ